MRRRVLSLLVLGLMLVAMMAFAGLAFAQPPEGSGCHSIDTARHASAGKDHPRVRGHLCLRRISQRTMLARLVAAPLRRHRGNEKRRKSSSSASVRIHPTARKGSAC
jgi:hypothetical protein